MQNTLQVNPQSISAHNLFTDKCFGATAGNHTDAILSVLLGARTCTSLELSSFFDWCRQPPRASAPRCPGTQLSHWLKHHPFFNVPRATLIDRCLFFPFSAKFPQIYFARKCVLTGFPNARQQTATVHCFESYLYHGWHPFRG